MMYLLDKQASASVQGAGYWVTNCDFFGCYQEYVYEAVWEPGHWLPAEWVSSYDPYFGSTLVYMPEMWIDGGWVYY